MNRTMTNGEFRFFRKICRNIFKFARFVGDKDFAVDSFSVYKVIMGLREGICPEIDLIDTQITSLLQEFALTSYYE